MKYSSQERYPVRFVVIRLAGLLLLLLNCRLRSRQSGVMPAAFVDKFFNGLEIEQPGDSDERVVIGTRHDLQFLALGAAFRMQCFRLPEGDQLVVLAMENKGGFGELLYFAAVVKGLFLGDAHLSEIQAEYLGQRQGLGKPGFDDQAADRLAVVDGNIDGTGAAQRTTHNKQGAGVAVVAEPVLQCKKKSVAVRQQGAGQGLPPLHP